MRSKYSVWQPCAMRPLRRDRHRAAPTTPGPAGPRTRCSSCGTWRRCRRSVGAIDIIRSEGDVLGPVVKGKPYSARSITESTQTLADGNRITQRNEAVIYRDSEGRTRREQTLSGVGPWQAGEPVTMINIHDPVAGKSYVLDPAERIGARDSAVPDGDRRRCKDQLEPRRPVRPRSGASRCTAAPRGTPPGACGVASPSPSSAASSASVTVVRTRDDGGDSRAGVLHGARGVVDPPFPPGTIGRLRARRGSRRASARGAARARARA